MAFSWMIDLVIAASILLVFIYFYVVSKFDTWKKKNVAFIRPTFPFGNFGKVIMQKTTMMEIINGFYAELKSHGFGGIFMFRSPALVVCKPDLVRQILTKDFGSFHHRGLPYDEVSDPFSANLFTLEGQRWKTIRAKLSPTFTSGKIKWMFPLIYECVQELGEVIQEKIKLKNGSVEMKQPLIRLCTDIVGTCAFGVQCHSLKNPDCEFYQLSREVLRHSFGNLLRLVLVSVFPKLVSVFTIKRVLSKAAEFFNSLIVRTVTFRRQNHVRRSDFLQMMMKINEEDPDSFSLDNMAAQAFIFFLAGLDNVAQTIGFCLHALAVDLDLQERVHEEIRVVLAEHQDQMSYEALGKMDLVSRVIDEGLRLYTPTVMLMRKQTAEKYVIPGTDVVIDRGTNVVIPTQAIHLDEEYFPNPGKFDPDRFTEDEKRKRHPYVYLPFGEGPRFCLASRFSLMEMRVCLAELVRRFHFGVSPETDLNMELDPKFASPTPVKGFWFAVSERNLE